MAWSFSSSAYPYPYKYSLLLAMLCGVGLALPFLVPQLYFLTWVAFIPLLACCRGASLMRIYCYGVLCGSVLFSVATYWMVVFITNLKGVTGTVSAVLAFIYWLYSAQLIALPLVASIAIQRSGRLPLALIFPLCFTASSTLYPQLFPMGLAESQTAFLVAIQGAELTGARGLDWVIISVNCLLYSLLVRRYRPPGGCIHLLPMCIVCAWFIFGLYRSVFCCDTGPPSSHSPFPHSLTVGLVQPNQAPEVHTPAPADGYTHGQPPQLVASLELAEQGAQLVVWPESRFTGYFHYKHVGEAFRRAAKEAQFYLLIQDYEPYREGKIRQQFSTTALLTPSGEVQLYRKNKLVPFGETTPGLSSHPFLRRWVRRVFGRFFTDLKPGEQHLALNLGQQHVLPLICYEVLFANYTANAAAALSQMPTIIIVQSNNAWFGQSLQAEQHFRSAILRAVEQRLPLLNVMNNGPSGAISPSGHILFKGAAFTEKAYLIHIPLAMPGSTFFSQHPTVFSNCVWVALFVIALLAGTRRWRKYFAQKKLVSF